jgi:phosphate transport system substrate-binding protein
MKSTYAPLSRPLFIYVKKDSLKRPEVSDFVKFYLDNVRELATEVGYVALPDAMLGKVQTRAASSTEGSLYHQDEKPTNGVPLEKLLGMP